MHLNEPFNRRSRQYFFFKFHHQIKYHLLTMLKIKCDIKQQYFRIIELHFVKSE